MLLGTNGDNPDTNETRWPAAPILLLELLVNVPGTLHRRLPGELRGALAPLPGQILAQRLVAGQAIERRAQFFNIFGID